LTTSEAAAEARGAEAAVRAAAHRQNAAIASGRLA